MGGGFSPLSPLVYATAVETKHEYFTKKMLCGREAIFFTVKTKLYLNIYKSTLPIQKFSPRIVPEILIYYKFLGKNIICG